MLLRAGKAGIHGVDVEVVPGDHVARRDAGAGRSGCARNCRRCGPRHRGRQAAIRGSCGSRARRCGRRHPRCRNRPCCPRAPCHASGRGACSTKFRAQHGERVLDQGARNAQAALRVEAGSPAPSWPRRRWGWPGRGPRFPAASAPSHGCAACRARSAACTGRPPCRGGRRPPPWEWGASAAPGGLRGRRGGGKGLRQHSWIETPDVSPISSGFGSGFQRPIFFRGEREFFSPLSSWLSAPFAP